MRVQSRSTNTKSELVVLVMITGLTNRNTVRIWNLGVESRVESRKEGATEEKPQILQIRSDN